MSPSTLWLPTCRRCPPAYNRGASLLRWRRPIPNAAPRRVPFELARRCGGATGGPGSQRRARGVCRVVGALKSPGARSRVAPGPPPPSASEKPSRRGDVGVWGSIRRVRAAPALRVPGIASRGQRPGVPRASVAVAAVLALSPLVPRARTGVSPALPWNALGCVGAGAPALSTAGVGRSGSSSSRPSLQTHFGWRPAINSELARTRGIRLSN